MKVIKKIISLVLWIAVLAWVGIIVYDYIAVNNDKSPSFCLSTETKEYSDGTVEICKGLGYNYYNYKRTSYTAKQFGPFFIKEHNPEEN